MYPEIFSSRYYADDWLALDKISNQIKNTQCEIDALKTELQFEQKYIQQQLYNASICETNNKISQQIISQINKKEEPFIVVFKSKPIKGIVLELWGKNPNYNWEREEINIC